MPNASRTRHTRAWCSTTVISAVATDLRVICCRPGSNSPAGLAAAIAQCPFTDGFASALAMHPVSSVKATLAATRDVIGRWRGRPAHMIPTAGPERSTALMTAPDAESGYLALVPPGADFRNEVAARVVFDILRYRPGRTTARIEVPALFAVCESDSVAPAKPTLRYAARAPRGEIRTYPDGHFAIYRGDAFERVVADQVDFLQRQVPVSLAEQAPG